MKRIYISGPITGMPDLNKRAFCDAEGELCAAGFVAVNPVYNGLPDSAAWHEHMRADIKMLMDCDGIAMLDGWWLSKGARLEKHLAERLGMRSMMLPQWIAEGAA